MRMVCKVESRPKKGLWWFSGEKGAMSGWVDGGVEDDPIIAH